MATRPASRPLQVIDGSGLPYFHHITNIVVRQPNADARIVLTITIAKKANSRKIRQKRCMGGPPSKPKYSCMTDSELVP